MAEALELDGRTFTLKDAARVLAGESFPARLARRATQDVLRSRRLVEDRAAATEALYGINTGFGKLARVRIAPADLAELQQNLILSHASGVGEPLPQDVARLILILRANALARGNSGVRVELIQRLLALFEAGVAPVIPSQGSVGASGDLAPLAHLALVLIGEGEAWLGGRRMRGARLHRELGITPLSLAAKEGLALINGTQVSTACAVAGLVHAERLARAADVAVAMTIEALRGSIVPFDARIHELRPHPGQAQVAANVRRLLRGSKVLPSHKHCGRVQDPYALRCAPQVHGAARDTFGHARQVLEREMNSVTDNPLIFAEQGDVLTGGNFHAEPVGMVADFTAIAVAELASISERRVENLVNPDLSGLPAFLARDPGLHSGFMIAQVTAASLVSENKTLAHPASVDSIPTSAGKEDHVSMATWAGRKLMTIAANTECVLAIELLCAAQGLDLHDAWIEPGRGVRGAYDAIRAKVKSMKRDRQLSTDIERVTELVRSNAIVASAERAAGRID